jgi:Ca-activated chloride channel family protein
LIHPRSWLAASAILILLAASARYHSPRAQGSQSSTNSQSTQRPKRVTDQEPTISLESNLVDVVFTVTDVNNRFVTDLTKESVALLEDGISQTIHFFGLNNEVPMVLALVVDFSGSQEFNWPKEREAAEKFFSDVFRWSKDYASLLSFRGTVQLHQGLTDDQDHLTTALQSLIRTDEGYASQGSSVFDAAFVTVDEALDGPTAKRILQRNDQRIRRAMILISDGHDTSSVRRLEEAIERAQRANVLVFSIGISDSFRFADVDANALDRLSSATGGRAYYPTSEEELRAAFKQIADELSSQYIIGYYPTNLAKDGGFRKVAVKVVTKDGLRVSHRAGYFAKKER